jgi:hypothetical protein
MNTVFTLSLYMLVAGMLFFLGFYVLNVAIQYRWSALFGRNAQGYGDSSGASTKISIRYVAVLWVFCAGSFFFHLFTWKVPTNVFSGQPGKSHEYLQVAWAGVTAVLLGLGVLGLLAQLLLVLFNSVV